MVLSHSRQIFQRFFLDARMENFLRGHVAAFSAWNGVPRVLLYDNLKSVVLERRGDAIRFHPTLLGFAGHYRFEPRPVAVARRNEKGRVERAIRYVRDGFFAARSFEDLDDIMPRPRSGATALPPTGAVPTNLTARSARCSPRRRFACCRYPTTRPHCSITLQSRSARHPTSPST